MLSQVENINSASSGEKQNDTPYKMSSEDRKKFLSMLMWDYNYDPEGFYEVAAGSRENIGHFDRVKAWVRILENMSWLIIVRLFGIDCITESITPEVISRLRFKDVRERYEFVRRVLHKEDLSGDGWSDENRERLQKLSLSYRRYRT